EIRRDGRDPAVEGVEAAADGVHGDRGVTGRSKRRGGGGGRRRRRAGGRLARAGRGRFRRHGRRRRAGGRRGARHGRRRGGGGAGLRSGGRRRGRRRVGRDRGRRPTIVEGRVGRAGGRGADGVDLHAAVRPASEDLVLALGRDGPDGSLDAHHALELHGGRD